MKWIITIILLLIVGCTSQAYCRDVKIAQIGCKDSCLNGYSHLNLVETSEYTHCLSYCSMMYEYSIDSDGNLHCNLGYDFDKLITPDSGWNKMDNYLGEE